MHPGVHSVCLEIAIRRQTQQHTVFSTQASHRVRCELNRRALRERYLPSPLHVSCADLGPLRVQEHGTKVVLSQESFGVLPFALFSGDTEAARKKGRHKDTWAAS